MLCHFSCPTKRNLPTYLHAYQPTYVPACLPTHLSTCLSIYISIYLPTYLPTLYLFIYLSVCLSIRPSIHPSIYPSIHHVEICIYLPMCVWQGPHPDGHQLAGRQLRGGRGGPPVLISLPVSLPVYQSIHPFNCLPGTASGRPSTCWATATGRLWWPTCPHLSTCLSTCLPIYPPL